MATRTESLPRPRASRLVSSAKGAVVVESRRSWQPARNPPGSRSLTVRRSSAAQCVGGRRTPNAGEQDMPAAPRYMPCQWRAMHMAPLARNPGHAIPIAGRKCSARQERDRPNRARRIYPVPATKSFGTAAIPAAGRCPKSLPDPEAYVGFCRHGGDWGISVY